MSVDAMSTSVVGVWNGRNGNVVVVTRRRDGNIIAVLDVRDGIIVGVKNGTTFARVVKLIQIHTDPTPMLLQTAPTVRLIPTEMDTVNACTGRRIRIVEDNFSEITPSTTDSIISSIVTDGVDLGRGRFRRH